jgi:hypothetical protein
MGNSKLATDAADVEFVLRSIDGEFWTGVDAHDSPTWSSDVKDAIVVRNITNETRVTFYGENVRLANVLAETESGGDDDGK